MLTKKQAELYAFIRDYQREHGISPAFEEMRVAIDLASNSGIHRLLNGMEERGLLRRLHHRHRAIELLPQREASGELGLLNAPKPPDVTELYVRARTEKPPALPYTGLKPRSW